MERGPQTHFHRIPGSSPRSSRSIVGHANLPVAVPHPTGPGHSPGAGCDAVSPGPREAGPSGEDREPGVECLTPEEKMDRYYRTTETGKKVAEIIEGKGK
jgi:hypothetical protein